MEKDKRDERNNIRDRLFGCSIDCPLMLHGLLKKDTATTVVDSVELVPNEKTSVWI